MKYEEEVEYLNILLNNRKSDLNLPKLSDEQEMKVTNLFLQIDQLYNEVRYNECWRGEKVWVIKHSNAHNADTTQ